MSEKTFKNNVNKSVCVHNQTTYTPYYRGTPDHWYSGKNHDLWVEYKFTKHKPKAMSWQHLLSSLQWKWCYDRYNEGRDVWVIVGYLTAKEGIVLRSPLDRVMRSEQQQLVLPVADIATQIDGYCMHG